MPNVIGTSKFGHFVWRLRLEWAGMSPGVYVRHSNGNVWLVPGTYKD